MPIPYQRMFDPKHSCCFLKIQPMRCSEEFFEDVGVSGDREEIKDPAAVVVDYHDDKR